MKVFAIAGRDRIDFAYELIRKLCIPHIRRDSRDGLSMLSEVLRCPVRTFRFCRLQSARLIYCTRGEHSERYADNHETLQSRLATVEYRETQLEKEKA